MLKADLVALYVTMNDTNHGRITIAKGAIELLSEDPEISVVRREFLQDLLEVLRETESKLMHNDWNEAAVIDALASAISRVKDVEREHA